MNEAPGGFRQANPLWAPLAFLLAGLSLSIGWGIRGNYGHETGAMLPGALTAIAVCLLSGREDWRERVGYFACFGALGWAFGGSMSYMQVIAYSHSGHAPSQYYGFSALFLIGFLWAALGAAGTALPAVLDRKSLCDLFQPLTLLLALWAVLYLVEDPLTRMVQRQFDARAIGMEGMQRHESVFYWFDSDWLSVLVILIGILAFDLVDRHFSNGLWLFVFAGAGGLVGHLAQWALVRTGGWNVLQNLVVRVEGDPGTFDPNRLVTNWPEIFAKGSDYIGAAMGLAIGLAVYFGLFGRFRRGSGLFLHMALGWFAGFLALPVLCDVRMTPPRGDNWAGIVGVYLGVLLYCVRHKLGPIVVASLVAGTIGGIGFSGTSCVEGLLKSFGNPNLGPGLAAEWTAWQTGASHALSETLIKVQPGAGWEFWQQANWHSFLEQSYGFINGLGLIAAMALLVRRTGPLDNEARRQYWPEIVAVTLAVPVLLYVNVVKNVADWTRIQPKNVFPSLPPVMRMPLTGFPLSAAAWFNVCFGIAALAFVILLSIHTRRRLAVLQQSWLGRGQLFFLVLLWAFVIGNFGKALTGFREQRLLTEGMITLNAVLATLIVLLLPKSSVEMPAPSSAPSSASFGRLIAGSAAAALLCAALVPPLETLCLRTVYGDAPVARVGARAPETRFGPHSVWKRSPLLKGSQHL